MSKRCLVAFGAHIGDMELTFGGVAVKYSSEGNRVVFVHLTAGERGHPSLPPKEYREQKVAEGEESARLMGSEFRVLLYSDGELEADEGAKLAVCDVIREVKPQIVVTHWGGSYHKDHSATTAIVKDAIFYASLPGFGSDLPRHSVGSLYFAENWEDPLEFRAQSYVDFSEYYERWVEAILAQEFIRGRGLPSDYPYADYYRALARIRGIESGVKYAEAFMQSQDWGAGRQRLKLFP